MTKPRPGLKPGGRGEVRKRVSGPQPGGTPAAVPQVALWDARGYRVAEQPHELLRAGPPAIEQVSGLSGSSDRYRGSGGQLHCQARRGERAASPGAARAMCRSLDTPIPAARPDTASASSVSAHWPPALAARYASSPYLLRSGGSPAFSACHAPQRRVRGRQAAQALQIDRVA
jgi:hypothetical protein